MSRILRMRSRKQHVVLKSSSPVSTNMKSCIKLKLDGTLVVCVRITATHGGHIYLELTCKAWCICREISATHEGQSSTSGGRALRSVPQGRNKL